MREGEISKGGKGQRTVLILSEKGGKGATQIKRKKKAISSPVLCIYLCFILFLKRKRTFIIFQIIKCGTEELMDKEKVSGKTRAEKQEGKAERELKKGALKTKDKAFPTMNV